MQRAIGAGTRANATVVGRRLLILALKGCMHLDEGQLETLAQETGHDFDWLRSVYHRLRSHMGRHVARLVRLREKRNRALFRAETLEYLLALEPDRQRALRLQRDLAEARDRLETVREAIARVPRTPTNLEISEATGIPKGSIDSILWKLRNRVTTSGARAKSRSRT
jgi:N-glycosylase/DNA lyase